MLERAALGRANAPGVSVLRILLIAQAFPPFNASGAVRVGKLARFLVDRGHDIRVLTAAPLPYPRTLPEEIPSDRIIVTRSLDPFALLARRSAASGRGAVPSRSLVGEGVRGRVVRWAGALFAVPEPQVGWYPFALAAGGRLLREWQADVIYASALPFTAHLVARSLAKAAATPWVAEFRDPFAGNPYSNLPGWRFPVDRWIERRTLSSAAACVTVSEPMAATLRERHRKRTIVVLNGYDERAAAQPAVEREASAGPVTILYTGLIYPGRRDPAPLFDAIASLGERGREVRVEFYGQDLRGVAESAARHGVSDRVHVGGVIPHADAVAAQRRADLLLLLLWDDRREFGVYTGKLFEYVGAGRPIFAIGSDSGVAADLLRTRGLGVAARGAEAIAAVLARFIDEKRATGRVAAPDPGAKAGLSRAEQFLHLESLLGDVADAAVARPAAVATRPGRVDARQS